MATRTQSNVVAVFRSSSDAQAAAEELKANGFSKDDIYIGSYSDAGTSETTSASFGETGSQQSSHHEGGIKGWFKSLFGEDEEHGSDRRAYETAVSGGGVLLSVAIDEADSDEVVSILEKYKPVDISNETSTVGTSASASASSTASTSGASGKSTTRGASGLPRSIPVVQEDLRVGKRTVVRGGVRIYSRVVEQPIEETVNLHQEHVRVERQPVNRAATADDLERGRDEVIEVQEITEEPVVAKEARVVEEVRVSKDATERPETVRDTVRRTEVNVEQTGPQDTANTGYDDDFRRDFQTRYASSGGSYEDYAPGYQYGYQAASDPRYQGRTWDQVESELRSDYGRRYPNSAWDRFKDSIRYGWDKVTGRAKSASGSR